MLERTEKNQAELTAALEEHERGNTESIAMDNDDVTEIHLQFAVDGSV
jgi:hypothetical protein